jgi:hypothetical protein
MMAEQEFQIGDTVEVVADIIGEAPQLVGWQAVIVGRGREHDDPQGRPVVLIEIGSNIHEALPEELKLVRGKEGV